MKKALLILLFLISLHSSATISFSLSKEYTTAYNELLRLEFTSATKRIETQRTSQPGNVAYCYLYSYIDFLKALISEEEQNYNMFKEKYAVRESELQKINSNSPWKLYTLGQLNLQSAFMSLKTGDYLKSAININRAYRLFVENNQKFPSFTPNKAGLGLLHILIGSVPESYNWIPGLIGIEGNVSQGMKELREVLSDTHAYPYLFDECMFLYTFITFNLAPAEENIKPLYALILSEQGKTQTAKNPILIYAVSSFLFNQGKNDLALDLLLKRPASKTHFPFHYLDYLTGIGYLNKLDSRARIYFLKYVSQFKGKNYIKSAYQRIAWSYLIDGDTSQYKKYKSRIGLMGNTQFENDKEAQQEFLNSSMPNKDLLKMRLLFDGGYYSRANQIAEHLNVKELTGLQKTELNYRTGRLAHKTGNIPKAKEYYILTYNTGKQYPVYYAANALLNLGMIYEDEGSISKALWYYKECLKMKYTDYRTGIELKAKSGINRINSGNSG